MWWNVRRVFSSKTPVISEEQYFAHLCWYEAHQEEEEDETLSILLFHTDNSIVSIMNMYASSTLRGCARKFNVVSMLITKYSSFVRAFPNRRKHVVLFYFSFQAYNVFGKDSYTINFDFSSFFDLIFSFNRKLTDELFVKSALIAMFQIGY